MGRKFSHRRVGTCLLALFSVNAILSTGASAQGGACPDSACIWQVQTGTGPSSPQGLGGIITGFDPIATGFDFYLQNSQGGPFTGIDFFTHSFNTKVAPYNFALGDSVVVEYAVVDEFLGNTELRAPNNSFGSPNFIVRKVSSGHPLPPFFVGTTSQLKETPTNTFFEQYEGCLVRIQGPLTVVRTSLTGGMGQNNAFLVINPAAPSDSVFIDGNKLTTFAPPTEGTPVIMVQGIGYQGARGYRILLRDSGDIEADTTGFPVLTAVVGRGVVNRSRTKAQYPIGSPLTLTATPLPGARFVAWSGDTASSESTLELVVQRPLSYVATFERDPAAAPNLAVVLDVPGDEGGKIQVHWQASSIDTGVLPGPLRCYQIQRRALSPPGAPWSAIDSASATSSPSYTHVVSTPTDSTLGDAAVLGYRLLALANADTAQWVSNEVDGYSVDNLAPPAPASVSGVIASGFASFSWPAVSAADLARYAIYRGLEVNPPTDAAHLIGTTTATNFTDSPGYFAHYRVTAVDVHGNESPGTLFAPINPADVSGKPAPKVLSVGNPSPSPMVRRMSMTLGLPRAMSTTVDVLDSQGRLVRRLCEGEKSAGWITLSWDARDAGGHAAAAGMYFVRVQTPGGRSVRRLALIP